jgi:hypothetical protein
MLTLPDFKEFRYNKPNFLNSGFVVSLFNYKMTSELKEILELN